MIKIISQYFVNINSPFVLQYPHDQFLDFKYCVHLFPLQHSLRPQILPITVLAGLHYHHFLIIYLHGFLVIHL